MGGLTGSLGGLAQTAKSNFEGSLDPINNQKKTLDWMRDPAGLDMFTEPQPVQPKAAAPVQEMPVAGDQASLAAKKRKAAAMQQQGGRSSTILTGDRLGD